MTESVREELLEFFADGSIKTPLDLDALRGTTNNTTFEVLSNIIQAPTSEYGVVLGELIDEKVISFWRDDTEDVWYQLTTAREAAA